MAQYCCAPFKDAVEGFKDLDGKMVKSVFRSDSGPFNDSPVWDSEGKYVGLMKIRQADYHGTEMDDGLALVYFKYCPNCGTQLTDYME